MENEHDFYNDFLIVFSEYDEDKTGKGWYAQDSSIKGWPSTELFCTREELVKHIKSELKKARYTT